MPAGGRRGSTVTRPATRPARATASWATVPARLWKAAAGLRGRRLAAAFVGTVAVVGIAVWTLWPSGPAPRSRQYLDFKVCLLTDAHGIAGKEAASVWSGMEKASLKTRARVQYLPAFGPNTVANTQPYLQSLIERRCDVILAVGDAPVSAVVAEAARHPTTRFVVAGPGNGRNVTSVNAQGLDLTSTIADTVARAVRAR